MLCVFLGWTWQYNVHVLYYVTEHEQGQPLWDQEKNALRRAACTALASN